MILKISILLEELQNPSINKNNSLKELKKQINKTNLGTIKGRYLIKKEKNFQNFKKDDLELLEDTEGDAKNY